MKTPERAAAKWSRNLANSIDDYKAGIQAVTVNPMQEAAAKADVYVRRVQEAVNSGKYQRRLLAVNVDDWKRETIKNGSQNLATKAQQAQPKYLRAAQELFPIIERIRAEVKRMPKDTRQQRIARSARFQEMMAEARGGQGQVPVGGF